MRSLFDDHRVVNELVLFSISERALPILICVGRVHSCPCPAPMSRLPPRLHRRCARLHLLHLAAGAITFRIHRGSRTSPFTGSVRGDRFARILLFFLLLVGLFALLSCGATAYPRDRGVPGPARRGVVRRSRGLVDESGLTRAVDPTGRRPAQPADARAIAKYCRQPMLGFSSLSNSCHHHSENKRPISCRFARPLDASIAPCNRSEEYFGSCGCE